MNQMLAEVAFTFCKTRTVAGLPKWEDFDESVLRFFYVPLDPYLGDHMDGNFGRDFSCLPVNVPPAVEQLSPPSHSEYDNLRVASTFAHSRMCGDAYASSVSSRGPMRSYFFLARPSGVAAASVTSPLTIRDWLIKGAKVPKLTLDIAGVPSTEDVVHTGTTPHVELWSDLIGSCPVSANG